MSEQKTVGNAWGDPISDERKAKLKALADKQREWVAQPEATRGDSAFKGVGLAGADMFWLADESGRGLLGAVPNLHLEGANLSGAQLEGANLGYVHLEGADLRYAQLEGAKLWWAHLEGASLTAATLDKTSSLLGAVLADVSLDQVAYDNVNLTVVDWSLVPVLGDELAARNAKDPNGKPKDKATRLREYVAAVRANRVLAVTLRSQGMNEDADRYAYRAQVLQRQVLWQQRKPLQALFSLFLDALAGHGYRPQRSLVAYLLAIFSFGIAYYFIGQVVGPHLSPLGAFVFSMTSFHGRGFFPGGIALDDPITVLAAFEAFTGLVIEVSFIATFTQRFFAR